MRYASYARKETVRWVLVKKKRSKETIVGAILDAIDRGHELTRIPTTLICILTSFFVSIESSVGLFFRTNLRHANNKVKDNQHCGTRETPVLQEKN